MIIYGEVLEEVGVVRKCGEVLGEESGECGGGEGRCGEV